jgi:hypothetical protein
MGMDHCRTDILVTKQLMNRPNSVTIFEKMIREIEKGMPLKFLHLPCTKEKAANRIDSGLAALLIQV